MLNLPSVFPADLNTNSIILQATYKNTYAILRLISVVSDSNFYHPVNCTSFNVLAFAYRYYKGCGGSRTRTCTFYPRSLTGMKLSQLRAILFNRFIKRLPIPPYHQICLSFQAVRLTAYQRNAWNLTSHIYHNLNHRADLNGIRAETGNRTPLFGWNANALPMSYFRNMGSLQTVYQNFHCPSLYFGRYFLSLRLKWDSNPRITVLQTVALITSPFNQTNAVKPPLAWQI